MAPGQFAETVAVADRHVSSFSYCASYVSTSQVSRRQCHPDVSQPESTLQARSQRTCRPHACSPHDPWHTAELPSAGWPRATPPGLPPRDPAPGVSVRVSEGTRGHPLWFNSGQWQPSARRCRRAATRPRAGLRVRAQKEYARWSTLSGRTCTGGKVGPVKRPIALRRHARPACSSGTRKLRSTVPFSLFAPAVGPTSWMLSRHRPRPRAPRSAERSAESSGVGRSETGRSAAAGR